MVIIICIKNESNLTNRYLDMVLDRQKVWTDGRRQNYTSGDKNMSPDPSGGGGGWDGAKFLKKVHFSINGLQSIF